MDLILKQHQILRFCNNKLHFLKNLKPAENETAEKT
jgi:hypothetical protein